MRKLRLVVPVVVILTMLLLMITPLSADAAPLSTAGGSGCAQFYRVQRGDTLARIANRFHTSVGYLQRLNGIWNPNVIYAGQVLCVRAGGPHPPPPPPHPGPKPPPPPPPPHQGGFWYTVRCGDTLSEIAHHFGWSVSYLASVNHICNPNLIYAGQRLWIPAH